MRVIVESRILRQGEEDRIRTETEGRLLQKEGAWYLRYQEPEGAGPAAGTNTILKLRGGTATILRTGPYPSSLRILPGKTVFAAYPTEAGVFALTLQGKRVAAQLQETGGSICLEYDLFFGTATEQEGLPEERQRIRMEIQVQA